WVTEEVRHVEDEPCVYQKEYDHAKCILQGSIWCEWNGIRLLLYFNAGWICLTGHMKCPDVQNNNARNHKWQEIVQRKEAIECWLINSKATQQEVLQPFTDTREGREEACDNGCAP